MFRKTLGVWLSIEPELTMNLNFKGKVEKVQNGLKNWQNQKLSLVASHLFSSTKRVVEGYDA